MDTFRDYHLFRLKEMSWVQKASSLDKDLLRKRYFRHGLEAIANKMVRYLVYFLRSYQNDLIEEIRCELTLRQGATDERLARGINEDGIISPDYGKPFHGRYIQKVVIEVLPRGDHSIESQTFLEAYFKGLAIQYFVMNVTEFSNWEFSHQNPLSRGSLRGNFASRNVNFPMIQILHDASNENKVDQLVIKMS